MIDIVIREFDKRDAETVSRLIRNNLTSVNSRDYEPAVIDYMCCLFTPDYLCEISTTRMMFVAEENGKVVGMVGLEGNEVCTLYVDPDVHGRRVGKRLLQRVEDFALSCHVHLLHLSASLTAIGFYEKMGYRSQEREESELFGPAYIMTKLL